MATRHTEHDACASDEAASDEAYESLIRRTRENLEASADLSPSQWVRVREGIDAGVSREPGARWAWAAVAIASASALLLSLQPNLAPSSPDGVDQSHASALAGALDEGQPVQPEFAVYEVGQELRAGANAEVFEAFGRHRLTLAAESALEVLAWSPRALSLRLFEGALDADIAKALPGERIEVETVSAVVRVIGTQFRVAVGADGATEVEVKEGVVAVTAKDEASNEVANVSAGSRYRVEKAAPERGIKAKAAPERRAKRRAAPKTKRGGYRLIEIDVPPQVAPNAR